MRALIVNPPRFRGVPVIREERCEVTERYSILPPYSLLQIASILRNMKHEVSLIDANGWNLSWFALNNKIKNADYDALVFRFTPTTFEWDTNVASVSKRYHPNATTIGICWTLHSLAKEVLSSAPKLDIYIRHEYESVTPSLINALNNGDNLDSIAGIAYRKDGMIKVNDDAKSLTDWNSIPLPAYDLLPSLDGYFINTPHGSPFTIIYASKGCPYACIFCTERNTNLKNRSAEQILNELRYLKKNFGLKSVSFFDETFTINKKRVTDIAEGIIKEKLNLFWYCNTRVNLITKDLLQTMYNGGCRGISYGVESGSQVVLDNSLKGIKVKQAEQAIKWAKDVGIKTYCSFIFGLPGENAATVQETIAFVRRTLPTGAQFNVAVPYPGTELYEIAVGNGWVSKDIDWRQMYQHKALMRTAELSNDELDKARKLAYRSLYFNPKWWLQNLLYTSRHPDDFQLASRYAMKILSNYVLRDMTHAH